MQRTFGKFSLCVILVSGLLFLTQNVVSAPPPLPNPVLYLYDVAPITVGGKTTMRYYFDVDNKSSYPADMFAEAPSLPPCGKNTKAARTWVDIYDQQGKRLNGFCALGKASDLRGLWFSLEIDEVPPSWVYIEMTDRQTNTKYKSNLAETSQ
jgi:hypothetical protein